MNDGSKGGKKNQSLLDQGSKVSLETHSREEIAAEIQSTSSNQIHLQLSGVSSKPLFHQGDRIRIKYWEEGIVYCWETEVLEASASNLTIALQSEGMTLQRRRYLRFKLSVPFSLIVTDAFSTALIGRTVDDCKTQDISLGGLRFESELPLHVGDKLSLKLDIDRSRSVSALGWVVRLDKIQREGTSLQSVGLEFLQLEPADQQKLLQFLAESELST